LLFACSTSQSASLASCLSISAVGEGRIWNLTFVREFNDWEVEEVLEFFHFIHSKIPAGLDPDNMRWKLRQHGNFDVKSFYHALDVRSELSLETHMEGESSETDLLFSMVRSLGVDSYL
jgi:hypothetical protein